MINHSALEDLAVNLFVDGAPGKSRGEGTFAVVNPSTGQRLFQLPAGCEEDVDLADSTRSVTRPSIAVGA